MPLTIILADGSRYEPGSAVTLVGESSQAGTWGPPNEPDSAAAPEMGTKPRRASGECVNGNSTLGTAALLTNEPEETTTMSHEPINPFIHNEDGSLRSAAIQGIGAQSNQYTSGATTSVADVHCGENCSRGGHTLACDYKTRSMTKASPPSQVDAAIDGPRSLENIVNDIALAEAAQKRLPALRKELDDQLAALGLELRKIRKTKGTTP